MHGKIFFWFCFLNLERNCCAVGRLQVFPLLAEVTWLLGWSCKNKRVHLVVEKVVLTWGVDAVQVPKGHLSSDATVKKDQAATVALFSC